MNVFYNLLPALVKTYLHKNDLSLASPSGLYDLIISCGHLRTPFMVYRELLSSCKRSGDKGFTDRFHSKTQHCHGFTVCSKLLCKVYLPVSVKKLFSNKHMDGSVSGGSLDHGRQS